MAWVMWNMRGAGEPYPLSAWSAQFDRVRGDLESALRLEEQYAEVHRTAEQRAYLSQQLSQFWDAVDRMFSLARDGKETEARDQIRVSLQARQAALSTAVSRLLVENNEAEQQAAERIARIYDLVQRQLYIFLSAA